MITVSCESKDHADFNNNALNVEEKYRSIGSSPLGGGGVTLRIFFWLGMDNPTKLLTLTFFHLKPKL